MATRVIKKAGAKKAAARKAASKKATGRSSFPNRERRVLLAMGTKFVIVESPAKAEKRSLAIGR
jgi:hypothetical protein